MDIICEPHRDADGEFAFRGVAVCADGSLRDIISDDLAFEFQVTAFAQDGESRLALEEIANGFREAVAEVGVDHRGVVREVGDGDRVRGLIIDVRTVEFIADAARSAERYDRYR